MKNKMSFETFMAVVSGIMMQEYGFYPEDLPDYDYYQAYTAGDTPNDTVEDAIEYAKGF